MKNLGISVDRLPWRGLHILCALTLLFMRALVHHEGSGNAVMAFVPSSTSATTRTSSRFSVASTVSSNALLHMVPPRPPSGRQSREVEIRRKIMELKKEGRIKKKDDIDSELDNDDDDSEGGLDIRTEEEIAMAKLRAQREAMRNNPVADEYADKIKSKLGSSAKGDMLGVATGTGSDDSSSTGAAKKIASLGRASETKDDGGDGDMSTEDEINVLEQEADADYDDSDEDYDDLGMAEEDLYELVAAKMAEKQAREGEEERARKEEEERLAAMARKAVEREEEEVQRANPSDGTKPDPMNKAMQYMANLENQKGAAQPQKTTTGIGGSWAKNETATGETRRPSRGSWGYFERPNDISKAYGGGKRVGAGYTKESTNSAASVEETRRRLQEYRERVGIDVQSEKDNAAEIEEALSIGQLAMQRGVYGSAVSALEKVTKYCSTNSELGGKVFLELAMAYEAVGRSKEAARVYTTLSTSRIEEIKFNAKKLLYGLEAMNFMRDEAKVKAFQKKNVQDTFIEATGMNNFAENFDDRYNTAWIDMDSGFYKQLTESVVRGIREARQILLQATGKGEVDRRKVVQALRSMSRYFDDALEKEIEENAPQPESVAMMNGKPILEPKRKAKTLNDEVASMEKFILASPSQMKEDLAGEWRLQLLADKRGDGVQFFNTTVAWQNIDTSKMEFTSSLPEGLLGSVSKKGGIEFNDELRVVSKTNVSGGGLLSALMSGTSSVDAPRNAPQQIMLVDDVLLVTKYAGKNKADDYMKEYFWVWRRVEQDPLQTNDPTA
mmetsp:Transcript_24716/g.50710  ORF Transcript_24716/g.50710 Transcript_24716/m.50710 type:complete len:784 (-) Transcript_24716:71-2422(-)